MPLITGSGGTPACRYAWGRERMTVSVAVTNGTSLGPPHERQQRRQTDLGASTVAPQCGAGCRCIGSARPVPRGCDRARNGGRARSTSRPRRRCGVLTRLLDTRAAKRFGRSGRFPRLPRRLSRLRVRSSKGATSCFRACSRRRGWTGSVSAAWRHPPQHAHLGCPGHARRGRHRLLHSPESAGEGRVSIQLA